MLQNLKRIHKEHITRQKVPDWAHIVSKGDFFTKMTKANFVCLLYLMMPQNVKKILREEIMRPKAAKIWSKLGSNYP